MYSQENTWHPPHRDSSCVLTARREYRGSPGLATRRIANSCWYMMMAARNAGLQEHQQPICSGSADMLVR